MNPKTKSQLFITAYCVVLWSTNWRVSTSYDRNAGLSESSLDLRGLGALVGGIVTVICMRRMWKLSRELFDLGARIPADVRIWGDWQMLWLLLPLAIGYTNHTTDIAEDGTLITRVFQYGGDLSVASIALSASAIMLFQTVVNLESFYPSSRQSQSVRPATSAVPLDDD